MSLENFVSMGGYGAYVWSCYALTLAALLWNVWSARHSLEAEIQRARRRTQMQGDPQP
jgi:heme exporter protein CcmD